MLDFAKNKSSTSSYHTISSFFENDPPQIITTPVEYYDVDHIKNLLIQTGPGFIAFQTISETVEVNDVVHLAKDYIEGVIGIYERGTVKASDVTLATADALKKSSAHCRSRSDFMKSFLSQHVIEE